MKNFNQFIFEKELSSNIMISYHGGKELSNNNIKDGGLFTTINRDDAIYYVDRMDRGSGWLTKMEIIINKPLICFTKEDFKNYWVPILEESNIEYYLDEEEDMPELWTLQCDEILKTGQGSENNPVDLIYIKKFYKNVVKLGYDGIIGNDLLDDSDIIVHIPFFKKNINVLSSIKMSEQEIENWRDNRY